MPIEQMMLRVPYLPRRVALLGLTLCMAVVGFSAATASAQTPAGPQSDYYDVPKPPEYEVPTRPSASKALLISKRANHRVVRAGGLLRYGIRVTNRTRKTARRVSVCDQLPRGVTVVRRTRPSKLRRTRLCFRSVSIRPRKSKSFSVVVRVDRDYRRRALRNTVSARLSGYRGSARGSRTVQVKRAPRPRVQGVVVTG